MSFEIDAIVSREDAQDLADSINLQFALGRLSTVNGERLRSQVSGQNVETAWQNGTVSVTVAARTPGTRSRVGTRYFKVGSKLVAR